MSVFSCIPAAAGASPTGLRVGGLQPLSTCDWPGRLVATVFCQGCPWRCGYCHNPGLISVAGVVAVPWVSVIELLKHRAGLLDGVLFSGGEPTMQPALAAAVQAARDLGFAVGLHTSGAYPQYLAGLLDLVDWVGLDIKAPPRHYRAVTGSPAAAERAWDSLRLLLGSGVAYEVRTTVDPRLLDEDVVVELADLLAAEGVRSFAVQQARPVPAAREPSTSGGIGLSPRVLAGLGARFETFTYRPR